MKNILPLLCLLFSYLGTSASPSTYNKLKEVNACWKEQKDIPLSSLPVYQNFTETEWIQIHLSLVEQTLRNRVYPDLSESQKEKRALCLDILHRYWQSGRFPQNEDYNYRTPIFIDRYNNFCAVGFLLQSTGYENIARKISAQNNLIYVKEIQNPALKTWADEYGFSIDELAWIQPGYPPNSSCGKIGEGVNGIVNTLFADNSDNKLYVGGSFDTADLSIKANNIAYVSEEAGGFVWHTMGTGVNGKVYAIEKHGSNIFVAGNFDNAGTSSVYNIAYWNGTSWHAAGCLNGTVYDLHVYKGQLYAAGEFSGCGSDTGNNLAVWNGSNWDIIEGLNGRVNTMETLGGILVLGGAFSYKDSVVNAIRWSFVKGFEPFSNNINQEVNDLEVYRDTLYAACSRNSKTDTNQFVWRLSIDKWEQTQGSYYNKYLSTSLDTTQPVSFKTLCQDSSTFYVAGNFSYGLPAGTYYQNCMMLKGYNKLNVPAILGPVNSTLFFNGKLIFGGNFERGFARSSSTGGYKLININSIGYRIPWPTSIAEKASDASLYIYPNPVASGSRLFITGQTAADAYQIYNMSGAISAEGPIKPQEAIQLPQLAKGVYHIHLIKEGENLGTQKLLIE